MSTDREPRSGQRRLPGFVEPAPAEGFVPVPELGRPAPESRAGEARAEGLRRVRRVSNWTAAALVVGTGAAAVALAHNAVPAAPTTFPAGPGSSATVNGATGVTHGASGPHVSHSVVTTSASGVTTTTTQLPNGKTVVSHSGNASTYHDN